MSCARSFSVVALNYDGFRTHCPVCLMSKLLVVELCTTVAYSQSLHFPCAISVLCQRGRKYSVTRNYKDRMNRFLYALKRPILYLRWTAAMDLKAGGQWDDRHFVLQTPIHTSSTPTCPHASPARSRSHLKSSGCQFTCITLTEWIPDYSLTNSPIYHRDHQNIMFLDRSCMGKALQQCSGSANLTYFSLLHSVRCAFQHTM